MDDIICYYSLVGERGIPVCMPIYFLLKENYRKKAEVTLIHTPHTTEVADLSASFLKQEFKNRVRISLVVYDDFIRALKSNSIDEKAEINLTPGMSWQVAEVILNLPENITCINMDYRYLYRYVLKDGIDSASPVKIDRKLTLKNYSFLNPAINIVKTGKPHRFINMYGLNKKNGFTLKLKNQKYMDWINHSLVWGEEIGGFLYLLFDLTEAGLFSSLKKKKDIRNPALSLYRMILATFNTLNYGITIISDNPHMRKRAELDGINAIPENELRIKEWIKCPPEPKKIAIPLKSPSIRWSFKDSSFEDPGERTLFLCLGDNVVTTLKAMDSHCNIHGIDRTVLFFDSDSGRLRSMAEYTESNPLIFGRITTEPTDHMGRGVIERIVELSRHADSEFFFNISPGTKAHTSALSTAARLVGSSKNVFSIRKEAIVSVLTGEVAGKVPSVPPARIISFYCPYSEQQRNEVASSIKRSARLWDSLLYGFAEGHLSFRGGGLRGIVMSGRSMLEPHWSDKAIWLTHRGLQGRFKLPEGIYNKKEDIEKGWWWEIVTYWAIHKHGISSRVLLNVLCYNHEKEKRTKSRRQPYSKKRPDDYYRQLYSEIDLVFSYREHIIAISCKTATKSLYIDALQLLSEARARFGRMAVCFLAVPHRIEDRFIKVSGRDSVRVLTPEELSDREKLVDTIERHIADLSTTTR
jgi:hypothetical protein